MSLSKPDYTADTATEYKTAIDEGFETAERTAWSFAPHPAHPTADMTLHLNAGAIWSSGALTEKAAQTTVAFTAPTTNPRIDRVVVDEVTGVYSIVAGTEAASPATPAIPSNKFPVCQIYFETTSTSISYAGSTTVAAITDERVGFAVVSPTTPALTGYYQSPDQTITAAGALTLAHGLSGAPVLLQGFLKCTTAELGYSIGDVTPVGLFTGAVNAGDSARGVVVVPDATNINIRFCSDPTTFFVGNYSTGAVTAITNANWSFFVRAWA